MNYLTNSIGGMQIVQDANMVEVVGEDWSKVRSPGRARRRRKKHRQNIFPLYAPMQTFLQFGNRIHCHPVMAKKLIAAAKERMAA